MSAGLSQLSDAELMRMLGEAPPGPASSQTGPAPSRQGAPSLAHLSDEELMRQLDATPPAPSTASRIGAVAKDIARSAESGVDSGVAGLIGAPNTLLGLANRGFDWVVDPALHALGRRTISDLPASERPPSIADGFPSAEAVAKSMEAATGPAYKPQTTAGEVAHTLGEFAPNALGGGGGLVQRAAQVVVPALASEGAGRAARVVSPDLEGPARLVGALAGGVGAAVAQAPRGASAAMREGLEGVSPETLAGAQALMEQSRRLPGGGVPLSLDEALNAVSGGQATRASQLARTVATGGGEGQRIASEFYAARPGQVDATGRAAFQGMALTEARAAAGPRITPEQAGQVIQPALREAYDRREGMRAALADQDYRAAGRAPETVGIDRTVQVERPGEPLLQTLDTGPRAPLRYDRPPTGPDTIADLRPTRSDAPAPQRDGPSLSRFIAEGGGIGLERGDVKAAGLDRWNQPGVGQLVRQDGRSIDNHWREELIAKGYLPPDADGGAARSIHDELIGLLQQEQRGQRVYPYDWAGAEARQSHARAVDEHGHAAERAAADVRTALDGAGFGRREFEPGTLDRAAAFLMRGEETDPLSAVDRAVMAAREPVPRGPTMREVPTTVTEEIPAPRFGQANPQSVLDHIAEAMRTAKGPAQVALQQARRTLFEQDGKTLDLSVAGLHGAREAIGDLIEKAPPSTQRLLLGVRERLDGALSAVPEYEAARSGFEAASRNLDPFTPGSAPGRVVAQDQASGRFTMPAEQVPGALSEGPTPVRDFLGVAHPEVRRQFEGELTTRLLDHATDASTGATDAGKLRATLRRHEDILHQVPDVRDRLTGIAAAREGMAAVDRSPLGQIAMRPEADRAIGVLFGREPLAGGEGEIGAAMRDLARVDPRSARQLARIHLESVFNDAVAEKRGLPAQYGGAGFASAVAGHPQQARNLEASIRALPDGDAMWGGLDRLLTTLRATGYRPTTGGDAGFNARVGEQLAGGKGVAPAIAGALANVAAGAGAAGTGGALAGGVLAAKKVAADAFTKYQLSRNGEAIARMLFDPAALPDLRALVKSPPGSKNALAFTNRLVALAGASASPRERARR